MGVWVYGGLEGFRGMLEMEDFFSDTISPKTLSKVPNDHANA